MHSKSPCRRRDEGFRSAGGDESENRGFRDLKKYDVYRYCCPINDVEKRKTKTRWQGCRLINFYFYLFIFIFFFFAVYCMEIDSKLTLHHMGKVLFFQLIELKLKSGG